MFYTYYHKYFISFIFGLIIMSSVVLGVVFTDTSSDRAAKSIIMEGMQFIEQGDVERGLLILEDMAQDKDNEEAMRILAQKYSNPNFAYYDVERAISYAELLVKKNDDYRVLYDEIKAQALTDWKR